MKLFIGIDPGLDGAVACIDEDNQFVAVADTPVLTVTKGKRKLRKYKAVEMSLLLEVLCEKHISRTEAVVAIEAVHAMPQQGVTSMFSLGYGRGLWEGITAALKLRVELVDPRRWKKEIMGSDTDKQASILKAQQLFPTAAEHLKRKRDHGRAEALLIAEHVRRHYQTPPEGATQSHQRRSNRLSR